MQPTDIPAFRKLIADVYAFYRQDASPFALDVWWQAMQGFELDAVRAALGRHCLNPDSGQFLPKPADVVKMLGGSSRDQAMIAWSKVERAVRDHGAWNTVVFDDPIIHRAVEDVGGWPQLCKTGEKEWPFLERRFCDFYRAHMNGRLDHYPPKLLGIIDITNIPNSFPEMKPKFIGNHEACQRLLASKKSEGTLIDKATEAITHE